MAYTFPLELLRVRIRNGRGRRIGRRRRRRDQEDRDEHDNTRAHGGECNHSIEAEDIEAVALVYRSGWLTAGPRTAAFERAFAEVVDGPEAVAVSSGTAALHLLLLAAGLGPGDEVIVPSLTFVATASAVAYTGAKPVFVDIESPTRPWLSAEASEAAVGPRTAAIVA